MESYKMWVLKTGRAPEEIVESRGTKRRAEQNQGIVSWQPSHSIQGPAMKIALLTQRPVQSNTVEEWGPKQSQGRHLHPWIAGQPRQNLTQKTRCQDLALGWIEAKAQLQPQSREDIHVTGYGPDLAPRVRSSRKPTMSADSSE